MDTVGKLIAAALLLQRDLPASEKAGAGADALPVRAGMRALLSDVFSVFFAHSGLFSTGCRS